MTVLISVSLPLREAILYIETGPYIPSVHTPHTSLSSQLTFDLWKQMKHESVGIEMNLEIYMKKKVLLLQCYYTCRLVHWAQWKHFLVGFP